MNKYERFLLLLGGTLACLLLAGFVAFVGAEVYDSIMETRQISKLTPAERECYENFLCDLPMERQ